nr:hypothetical protein [Tanacetum cinerariifolium]
NIEGWKLNSLKNKSFADIQELFDKAIKRVNTFLDYKTELVEGSSKRAGTEFEQKSSKKQKIDDDKETAELKQEDVETLWKLVKAKHGSTRLEEGYERVLWGDLKNGNTPLITQVVKGVDATISLATVEEKAQRRPTKLVARRVTDDLIAYSGETAIPRYIKFFLDQKIAKSRRFMNRIHDEVAIVKGCIAQLTAVIAELQAMRDRDEVHDSLLAVKDAKRCEESKLLALNDVIAEALDDIDTQEVNVEILDDKMKVVFDRARSEEKSFVGLMRDLCFLLKISLSKKRRLVAELEALVERGDAAKPLKKIREIVARDSMTLKDLEKLLARDLVRVSLKDGYVADMEEKE